jgi:hypothetical protein
MPGSSIFTEILPRMDADGRGWKDAFYPCLSACIPGSIASVAAGCVLPNSRHFEAGRMEAADGESAIIRISIKLLDNCFRRSAGRRYRVHATLAFSHNMRLFVEYSLKLLALSNLQLKPAPADQGQSRLIKANQG